MGENPPIPATQSPPPRPLSPLPPFCPSHPQNQAKHPRPPRTPRAAHPLSSLSQSVKLPNRKQRQAFFIYKDSERNLPCDSQSINARSNSASSSIRWSAPSSARQYARHRGPPTTRPQRAAVRWQARSRCHLHPSANTVVSPLHSSSTTATHSHHYSLTAAPTFGSWKTPVADGIHPS